MPITLYREHHMGDMIARYVQPENEPGTIGLVLIPASRRGDVVAPREHLTEPHITSLPAKWLPIRAWGVDPLVHVSLRGDPRPGAFAQGRTLRHAPATAELRLRAHTVTREGAVTTITTELASPRGLVALHRLLHAEGERVLRSVTTVRNDGADPVTLELLTSFSLGGITPFAPDDAPERLWVHRFRSTWSAEGRPLSERVEDLQLEPSWIAHGVRCQRFGIAGSHPISGWFPQVGVEDRGAGVTWAAQLAVPGSWQLELYRRHDQLALSGGLADRELGHWEKTLQPGESFTTPEAWLTVCAGGPDTAWPRLQDAYRSSRAQAPSPERTLPPVFNEWCTSWGNPTHDNLIALADRLQGSGVAYLVIDDGWAERPPEALLQSNGDWRLNSQAFPHGPRATADAIRARGLIPGIWFEFEVCNPGAEAWSETAHQLHRDGRVLEVGPRRYWDFRDPWVHEHLAGKVLRLVREAGIGYLKVDYNDTIGPGCDGAESLGEGLRAHLDGVLAFFARLRRELPDLVIENCASGGHRESASFVALTAMTSFSDAHETPNIPIVAANLLPLLPVDRTQVWAVLRKTDSARRLHASLASTFLGRMCLSGEIHDLDEEQWRTTRAAITLHRALTPLLVEAESRRLGEWGVSINHPRGWQAVVRTGTTHAAVILHTFAHAPQTVGPIALPAGWRIEQILASCPQDLRPTSSGLFWHQPGEFAGAVVALKRN
jgi:alpha-galactosidase